MYTNIKNSSQIANHGSYGESRYQVQQKTQPQSTHPTYVVSRVIFGAINDYTSRFNMEESKRGYLLIGHGIQLSKKISLNT